MEERVDILFTCVDLLLLFCCKHDSSGLLSKAKKMK